MLAGTDNSSDCLQSFKEYSKDWQNISVYMQREIKLGRPKWYTQHQGPQAKRR